MKIVLVLAVVGLAVGKPTPQQGAAAHSYPQQGVAAGSGIPPKRKLWLKLDGDSLEVFGPRPSFKNSVQYSKVGGKAVPSYYYGSSEELYYGSPSVAYAKSQFKSQPLNTQSDPNFYYDNSGELKMVPDPAMFSQVYGKFYSNLPVQGPNAPRYYIDDSGEVGIASDRFMSQVFRENNNSNLYRDNSGELVYVYPQGSGPGSSPNGSPVGSPAVVTA